MYLTSEDTKMDQPELKLTTKIWRKKTKESLENLELHQDTVFAVKNIHTLS